MRELKKLKVKIKLLPWVLKRHISRKAILFFMKWLDVECVQFYGTQGKWNTITHVVKCKCGTPFQVQSSFMPGKIDNPSMVPGEEGD